MSSLTYAFLLLAFACAVDSTALRTSSRANPIRRVVTMLQMMQKKVEQAGEKNKELFEKFMCYCENADETLGVSIKEAEEKIPQLESSLKELIEVKQQLDDDLVKHKADRKAAKEAIATATAIRAKEAAAFAKESEESKANLDAIAKAIPAIEKGLGGFLQTSGAQVLQQLTINSQTLSGADRSALSAFLSQNQGDDAYAPGTDEIVGILKQMQEDMSKDLADLTSAEQTAIADFDALIAAKEKEIAAATKAIEEKSARVGEVAVEIATTKNDLEDTQEQLAEDKKFLADLDNTCELKKKEWATYQKMHSQELLALADTIKMLNDDDALDLFKKALPGAASLIQMDLQPSEVRQQALGVLRSAGKGLHLDFIALALHGKKVGFEKVIQLIDDMCALLAKEQKDDDAKKEYCAAEFDKAEDEKKALEKTSSDLGKTIEEGEDMMGTLNEELDALKKGIAELDVSVARATEQRKEENAEFTQNLAGNSAAKDLIEMAKNRLNKFYNPKLYKEAPKRELTEEERITLNMGGTLAPTNPPGGIAGTGITALNQAPVFAQVRVRSRSSDDQGAAPPPPPAADLSYKKSGEESGGVIAMMDTLKADLDKEILEMEMEEKNSQEDYEKTMKAASEKRGTDSKAITEKEGAKAELESELQKSKDEKKATDGELMANAAYVATLHADCDWLLMNYDARKEARTNEIDAMKKAKDVLNGADYSLLQTKVTRRLRRA